MILYTRIPFKKNKIIQDNTYTLTFKYKGIKNLIYTP